ncbi:peptide ABC transporter substrate-binding protein [Acidocella sp.]|uniref:peptide ABC transporter substrate-binding protein n=1 Tax=Acidocella sp. TaxID=50710 RepID=UPI00260697A3|nr:peptide ABC transporter substrate-binding protein [Acidocella sp.]
MRRLLGGAALLLGLGGGAMAAPVAGDCGTIILPTGIGIAPGADITGFNPLLSNSLYNAEAAGAMFQPLIWVNGWTLGIDWSRSLASAIATPDEGLSFDVTMRPWMWSDGAPVTSADVAFTWKLIQQFGPAYAGYGAGGMPGIVRELRVTGPRSFTVLLRRRVNPQWFILNGLGQLTPLPAHAWAAYDSDEIYQRQSDVGFFQVVDGPLRPAALNIGQDMVFTPNPVWPGGGLHFSRLIFKFVQSAGQTLQQFEAGELDMINAPMALWRVIQSLPGARMARLAPGIGFDEMALNLRNPEVAFFRDVRVRQAMADAIDQEEMISLIDHGLGEAHRGPVPPQPPVFLTPAMRDGRYPVGYDPARARALLREAGFTPGPDGILEKNGQRLSFTELTGADNAAGEQMTVMIQAYLRRVGIEMKARRIEFNQMLALLNDPGADWQAAALGESGTAYPTGEDLFKTGSYGNAGGYSDPEMDRLIDASTSEPGLEALYAYETYASAQQPVIFLPTGAVALLVKERIAGAAGFADPLGNYDYAALSCPGPARPRP